MLAMYWGIMNSTITLFKGQCMVLVNDRLPFRDRIVCVTLFISIIKKILAEKGEIEWVEFSNAVSHYRIEMSTILCIIFWRIELLHLNKNSFNYFVLNYYSMIQRRSKRNYWLFVLNYYLMWSDCTKSKRIEDNKRDAKAELLLKYRM